MADQRSRYHQLNETGSRLASATVGALSELLAAVDLMSRGFEVFRALSAACSCDLAVLVDGNLIRVEVRTGKRTANGKLAFPRVQRDGGRQDVYAIVVHSLPQEILYLTPDLEPFALLS
jgi:hypothetical protein